jgi:hypothetical protein
LQMRCGRPAARGGPPRRSGSEGEPRGTAPRVHARAPRTRSRSGAGAGARRWPGRGA